VTLTKFYKLAQPDGWDFRTGQTINYRENIGKAVRVPRFDFPDEKRALCTDTVLHASRTAIDALQYAKIPCSIYCVQGNPIVRDTDKFGFKELKVLEEVPPTEFDELLGFRYQEVLHPFDPRTIGRKEVGREELEELRAWASVWDSVRASVWASVWDSVRASVRASVWASVRASVWASVRASVWASVWDSVRASVWDSVRASVRASEAAYIGSLFVGIKKWKYTEKLKVRGYPFQTCVDLIRKGLVPATDGRGIWYLTHPIDGKPAEVVWKGVLSEEKISA
jgi:hypothetical protein